MALPAEAHIRPLDHVLSALYGSVWAIVPAKLVEIRALVALWAAGGRVSAEDLAQYQAAPPRIVPQVVGAVQVLPLYGTLIPRANMATSMSGGTSLEQFSKAFRQALADPSVGAIVLDVDSPGGAVDGTPEAADLVRSARGKKPVLAVANGLMASAAYWIGSQADSISITQSGEMGSIGVLALHEDYSRQLEAEGVTTTMVTAGKFKGEGADFMPLSEDARAYLQQRVDDYYGMFLGAVARGRGTTVEAVRSQYGEGRTVGAKEAVRLGMADRVETFDVAVSRMQRQLAARQVQQAALAFSLTPDQVAALKVGEGDLLIEALSVAMGTDVLAMADRAPDGVLKIPLTIAPAAEAVEPPAPAAKDDRRRRRLRLHEALSR